MDLAPGLDAMGITVVEYLCPISNNPQCLGLIPPQLLVSQDAG